MPSRINVNNVGVSDTDIDLTLVRSVANTETITVAYTKPGTNPLQDAAGNEVATFSAQSVAIQGTGVTATTPVVGTRTTNTIAISWTSSSNQTYRIRLGSNAWVSKSTATTHTFSGLSSGILYTITLETTSTVDNTTATDSVTAWTQLSNPVISTRTTGSTATVTWSNVRGATSYSGRYRQGSGAWGNYSTQTSPWAITGLTASTAYTFQIRANRGGDSSSASATATTMALASVSAPTVSIDNIPTGGEGSTVSLTATLSGGNYDAATYAWSANGGTFDSAVAISPIWTRPSVTQAINYTISLVVTVTGLGVIASTGTATATTATRRTTVTNVADTTAPDVVIIKAERRETVIVFNEDVSTSHVPAASAFTLEESGTNIMESDPATAVSISGTDVTLTHGAYLSGTTDITVSYAKPSSNPLQDGTGNEVDSFTNHAASNNIFKRALTAPSISISDPGDTVEGRIVTLGGSGFEEESTFDYDGRRIEWSVGGGTLDDATAVEPRWTAPTIETPSQDYLIRLSVTFFGDGTNINDGDEITVVATPVRVTVINNVSSVTAPRIWGEPERDLPYQNRVVDLYLHIIDGNYDTISYSWSDGGLGGTFLNANVRNPTYITSRSGGTFNASVDNYDVVLTVTVTVGGTGIKATDGMSATVRDRVFFYRDPPPLANVTGAFLDDRRSLGIYAGGQTELGESESIILLIHNLRNHIAIDTFTYSWSISTGGGSLSAMPSKTTGANIIKYTAPSVSSDRTATIECEITVGGTGVNALASSSDVSQTVSIDLTIKNNPSSDTDNRGPTTERGRDYADSYYFINVAGGSGTYSSTPWTNTTPGRIITYAFVTSTGERSDRYYMPLINEWPIIIGHNTKNIQHEIFRQAFSMWEQYLNVIFVETSTVASANIIIGLDPRAHGFMYTDNDGDVSEQIILVSRDFGSGSQPVLSWEGAIHEIGHCLGLGHPHLEKEGGNLDDSLMEYLDHDRAMVPGFHLWSAADIIGAQHIWGPNPEGSPQTVPDVVNTFTLTKTSSRNLLATWTAPLINGGTAITGYILEWYKDSDPTTSNTPLGGGTLVKTDTLPSPNTLSRSYTNVAAGNWSAQIRAVNKHGNGLRKRAPVYGGEGITVT